MLRKPHAVSVGQLDPLAVARATKSYVGTMNARRIVATLVRARYRLSAYYRAEIVRLLRGEEHAARGASLDAETFANVLRTSPDADLLSDALIQFLCGGNLRVIDVIGGGFAAAIIRAAEDDLPGDADAVLAVEQEREPAPLPSWGRVFQLVALCAVIVIAGGVIAAGVHYAGSLQTVRPSRQPVPRAVVSATTRSEPFVRFVKFSSHHAPFRQVILSAHPQHRRL